MATDGVKIIDSDTAHDIYWGIMDLYDSGATSETIRKKFLFSKVDYFDDFDYEIYISAYALAMWEIGFITNDIIEETRKVIEKGACAKYWTEEIDIKSGKLRQKELEKLWNKITSVNVKTRKRKKYKQIDKFLFEINDVLTFQLNDKNWYATVILNITQYHGKCTYRFGKIFFKSKLLPSIIDIANCELIGRKIPSGHNMDLTKILSMGFEEMMKQGGLDEIIQKDAERTGSFKIGMDMIGIDHNDLINISDKFIQIGNLYLKEVCKEIGSLGGASTFEELTREFADLDEYLKVFKLNTFSIKELIAK